jgi:hypothetical protein
LKEIPPGLSVRQPWAYLIFRHAKNVENRSTRIRYNGPLLIQAALTIGPAEREEAEKRGLNLAKLVRGAIVGTVDVVDCVQDSKSGWAIPGKWHWILSNPRELVTPIPFKGKLGRFYIPSSVLKKARFRKAVNDVHDSHAGPATFNRGERAGIYSMADALSPGQRAALKRKHRAAGKKAALKRKHRAAGKKAAATRKRRAAAKKASLTRKDRAVAR